MRQIQYKLPNVILTEIPERQLRKDTDVKVRIAYAAVCGSDIHDVSGDFDNTIHAGEIFGGTQYWPRSLRICGRIRENATSKGLKVGDKVALYYNCYCGKCHFCNIGKQHLCENIDVTLGFMSRLMW